MLKDFLIFIFLVISAFTARGQSKEIVLIIDTVFIESGNEETELFEFNLYSSKHTGWIINRLDTSLIHHHQIPNVSAKLLIPNDSFHILLPLDKENSFCILMNPCHFPGDTIRISSYKVFNKISLDSARYDHFSYNTRKGVVKTKQSHIISNVIHDTIPFDSVTLTINKIITTRPVLINETATASCSQTTIHKRRRNYCYNKSSIIHTRKIEINLEDFH